MRPQTRRLPGENSYVDGKGQPWRRRRRAPRPATFVDRRGRWQQPSLRGLLATARLGRGESELRHMRLACLLRAPTTLDVVKRASGVDRALPVGKLARTCCLGALHVLRAVDERVERMRRKAGT